MPLHTFAADKNRKTRLNDQRLDRGYTPASKLPTVFRQWQMEVWDLTGPSKSWNEQLENYYKRTPVFALVGGLSHSTWAPMDLFCERHKIPCLLPSTDLPEVEQEDFYTLYFSKGLAQEAHLIAHHLATQGSKAVTQVYCSALATQAAKILSSLLTPKGIKVVNHHFDCEQALPAEFATRMTMDTEQAAVLWLDRKRLSQVIKLLPPATSYLSSTFLNQELENLPAPDAGSVFLAHPFQLPESSDPAMKRFKVWARMRGIDITYPRQQAEAFFASLALNHSIKHMGRFFIRDFFLDTLDHAQGLAAYIPIYPEPSLGPGQRFLAKGGYIVPLKDGKLQSNSAHWIVP